MLLSGAYIGFTIAFLADPLRAAAALPQVRPTILPSVPRVYEKVHTAVQARFDEATGVKRRLVDWALPIGREVSRLEGEGKPILAALAPATASPTASSSRRSASASVVACASRSGGAPLAREIADFFDAVGIRIVEGYGLTECTTAASTNTPSEYRSARREACRASRSRSRTTARSSSARETVFQGYF